MRGRFWRLICFAVALGLTSLPFGLAGEPAASPIRMGMLVSMFRSGKPAAFAALKGPFASVVHVQTGLDAKLDLLPSVDEMRQQLSDGKLQFGLCHGFEFAWMKQKDPSLRPLMVAAPAQRPLKGYVVVASTNQAKSLDDLRGKKVALPKGIHETARLFAARRCHCEAGSPSELFGEVTTPVNAETALHEVYDDKVQAAIVDKSGLQCFAERFPARFQRVRILEESESFPMSVVAIRDGAVSDATLRQFQNGMGKAHVTIVGRQLVAMMQSAGFEPVPPDYDRQVAEITKHYPASNETSKRHELGRE
jgi:ABC-type phosphate/phosphonate transport system substrate-binding protein